MSKVFECVYRDGALQPLESVPFRDGEILKVSVERGDLSRYRGAFGKARATELKEIEDEVEL
jgi:predicted DNA-binding antitoxin AbrB/MazE fold protein